MRSGRGDEVAEAEAVAMRPPTDAILDTAAQVSLEEVDVRIRD